MPAGWNFFDSAGARKNISVPRASLVTALPSAPTDGDEIILTDSLSAGTYAWHLRYVAARSSNKWVFVGGAAMYAEVTTSETTAATAYAALTTPGPSIAVPVAGDYFVGIGLDTSSQATADAVPRMSYDIGATGAVDADSVQSRAINGSVAATQSLYRKRKKAGLTAVTLTAKYRTSAGTSGFEARWMELLPIAIGG